MIVHVVRSGMLTSVQDLGRYGLQHLGIVPGGAMDAVAHRIANALVGNPGEAATLECTLLGPELVFEFDSLIALYGAAFQAKADGVLLPRNRPVLVKAGTRLSMGTATRGARAYLAIAGGFQVPEVLGSRSTYMPAEFGGLAGRAVKAGDRLPCVAELADVSALRFVVHQGERWSAVISLRAPVAGAVAQAQAIDPARVRVALAATLLPNVLFVDVKGEAGRLYAGYLEEAIRLSLAGLAAIAILLLVALRRPVRVLRVMAPLLAAVLVVVAGLALAGKQLTILHLVGLLLIVAIGSNYALFFDRRAAATGDDAAARMLASLLCANLTTVAGFGLLAFSTVPVLQAIGITVGPGAILSLVFAAILTGRADDAGGWSRQGP